MSHRHDLGGQVHALHAAVALAGRGRAAGDSRRDHARLDDRRQRADVARVAAHRSRSSSIWRSFLSARSAFGRLGSLLDAHPERPGAAAPRPPTGQVRLQGLVATAPSRAEPILKSLDASFAAGQLTAILGPSGSGKSTLARVLVGIWPYTEGRCCSTGIRWIAGTAPRWARTSATCRRTSSCSRARSPTTSRASASSTPEQVIEAAQRAGMHDMILRLPKGYDTPIGEAGSLLSGGQRQRIGLARALYGDPR